MAANHNKFSIKSYNNEQLRASKLCSCGCGSRRQFIEAAATALLPLLNPSSVSGLPSDYIDMLNRFHPPRPDWYEEFYASVMNSSMNSYEAEIADYYKSQLFDNLRGKAVKALKIGTETGPNLNTMPVILMCMLLAWIQTK